MSIEMVVARSESRAMGRAVKSVIAIVVVAVLAVVGVGVWYFFIRDDAPAPLELSEPASTDEPADEAGAVDGEWVVTTEVQPGDLMSVVGYRVEEKVASLPTRSDGVGRTAAVTGSLTIAGSTIETVEITADMTQLESDQARRDESLETRGLQTNDFPQSTFALTAPIDLGAVPEVGEDISATATGDLTLHGVTQTVEVPVAARWSGDTIEVFGTLPILMADYGIDPPSVAGIVDVDDNGEMEFQLFFVRA